MTRVYERRGITLRRDCARSPSCDDRVTHVILRLRDPSYTERLASFLASVGLAAAVTGPDAVELADGSGRPLDAAELEIYLRVWRVLEPNAEIDVES
jgi:hypothetical protein